MARSSRRVPRSIGVGTTEDTPFLHVRPAIPESMDRGALAVKQLLDPCAFARGNEAVLVYAVAGESGPAIVSGDATKSKLYQAAKESVDTALKYAFVGRRNKKRDFRRLWALRINAAARDFGYTPAVTVTEGLERLKAWFDGHPDERSSGSTAAAG